MSLDNFSSLIEVATALNIAFVAMGYLETFSKLLYKQTFKINRFFDKRVKFFLFLMKNLEPIVVHRKVLKVSHPQFKSLKDKVERLIKCISTEEDILKKIVDNHKKVLSPNYSSVSFLLLLYCLTALFLVGIEYFGIIFWTTITILVFLYSLFAWIIKPNQKNILLDFTSLSHPIVCYASFVIISIFLENILPNSIENYIKGYINWVIIFSMLFLFSNYIIATIKVWVSYNKMSKEIKATEKSIGKQYDDILHELFSSTNNRIELLGDIRYDIR